MRIRRLYDDLTGATHHRALDALHAQLAAALGGVRLTARMTRGELTPAQARAEMVGVEHDGDSLRAVLVRELSTALTTPIDREDLYRLSRSVDDVLDNLRDLVRETDLYRAVPDQGDLAMLTAVGDGLALLQDAIGALPRRPAEVTLTTLAVRKCASRIRQLYQSAVAVLFEQEVSTDMLKRRELLRRLDVVGLRLGECADALSDAMLKRSH
ncbi:hypothetical protein Kfla_3847 [Kribbella flavida DSM 17836]|uniref:Phosphate transport regulator-like protein n=1 Tax=Kribbella flavida (strain DSM 17836 / JCM 10339 / NBRC 14399) TaxID=479435 RepID=D2PPX6_KRIFD|nr:DUF47 family protein [Kribbella flavida]ADB32900.1 hypothetical protein Kfla_3847 [Kribbella flavida DSM 17836]